MWTFFTNHAHVLFLLSMRPDATAVEIANEVGITERAARRIIADLSNSNFIKISKSGRKNVYEMVKDRHLKHPVEKGCTVGELLKLVKKKNS